MLRLILMSGLVRFA